MGHLQRVGQTQLVHLQRRDDARFGNAYRLLLHRLVDRRPVLPRAHSIPHPFRPGRLQRLLRRCDLVDAMRRPACSARVLLVYAVGAQQCARVAVAGL